MLRNVVKEKHVKSGASGWEVTISNENNTSFFIAHMWYKHF